MHTRIVKCMRVSRNAWENSFWIKKRECLLDGVLMKEKKGAYQMVAPFYLFLLSYYLWYLVLMVIVRFLKRVLTISGNCKFYSTDLFVLRTCGTVEGFYVVLDIFGGVYKSCDWGVK